MAYRIPSELRKVTAHCGCISFLLASQGETIGLQLPSCAQQHAIYSETLMEPRTAADYPIQFSHQHGEREDFTTNGWDSRFQISVSASGTFIPGSIRNNEVVTDPVLIEFAQGLLTQCVEQMRKS